jgi:hypothetical protein
MTSLWEQVRALEGWTLPTVNGRALFDISAVDDGFVRVVPHSSGKPRAIKREEFERAEMLGLATAGVTPIQLRRAGISEFNPAYVAAIIRAAVGQVTPA